MNYCKNYNIFYIEDFNSKLRMINDTPDQALKAAAKFRPIKSLHAMQKSLKKLHALLSKGSK